jgi:hypothetical protein
VEGILAFAERVLPRAADLWVQASLDQRQRFQQLFFPDGIAFDGKRFIGTGVTAPAFSYLREMRTENEGLGLPTVAHALVGKRERRLVDLNIASWNQLLPWLRRLDILRGAQVLAG